MTRGQDASHADVFLAHRGRQIQGRPADEAERVVRVRERSYRRRAQGRRENELDIPGGSSTSLSSAGSTMWASLDEDLVAVAHRREGGASSRRSRASSTPPCEAASISTTSSEPGRRRPAHGAGFAPTARGVRGTLRTAQTARQDARGRSAHPRWPREQVRVSHAIRAQRRLEPACHSARSPGRRCRGDMIQRCGHPPSLLVPLYLRVPRRAFHSVEPLVPSA